MLKLDPIEKLTRRGFLFGIGIAPFIVKATSIMPISAIDPLPADLSPRAWFIWRALRNNPKWLPDLKRQLKLPRRYSATQVAQYVAGEHERYVIA